MRLLPIATGLALMLALSPVDVRVRADEPAPSASSAQTTATDQPSRTWLRMASTNFVVVGDAPEPALRDALTELEVFRSAMLGLSPFIPAPRVRTATPLMILFRNNAAFTPYKPRDERGRRRDNVGGYYVNDPAGAYMVMAADGRRLGERLHIVLHEYGHDVFHFTLGSGMPPWIDEGLAELCGSIGAGADSRFEGRFLGRPLIRHVVALRRIVSLPTAELIAVDHARLRAMNSTDSALFYAKSWALLHYLLLGREDRQPDDVPAFLAALEAGRSPVDAFQAAFRVDIRTIDATLTAYVRRPSMPALRIDDGASALRATSTIALLESEVDQLQGQLLLEMQDMSEAEKRLSSAFARNPDAPATRLWLARHRLAQYRFGEAIDLLEPVVAADPSLSAALLSLGRARQQTGRYREALDAFTAATPLTSSTTADADAWYGRSLAAASLDLTSEAADAMAQLQSIDGRPTWYARRARDLWAAGRDALVIADTHTVLASEGMVGNLKAYAAFVGALSAKRLNQSDEANELLARAEALAPPPWTRTVLAYLRGEISDRDFLSKASGQGEETEAHAYIGLTASLAGRLDEAIEHLTWVRDRGSRTYAEYGMARAELAKLEMAASR